MCRQISPYWAFYAGIFVVPLACALNAVLASYLSKPQVFHPNLSLFWWDITIALFFSGPLGVLTSLLIACWNGGHFIGVRVACGIVTLLFLPAWNIYYSLLQDHDSRVLSTTLLLPFIWTLLFPVFALCARKPKVGISRIN